MDFDEFRFQEGWSRYQGEEVSVWPSVVNVIHPAYIATTFPPSDMSCGQWRSSGKDGSPRTFASSPRRGRWSEGEYRVSSLRECGQRTMYVTALLWLSPLTSIIFYASETGGDLGCRRAIVCLVCEGQARRSPTDCGGRGRHEHTLNTPAHYSLVQLAQAVVHFSNLRVLSFQSNPL